jgi:ankyrin repeat protein
MGNNIYCSGDFDEIRNTVVFAIRRNNVRSFQRSIINFNIKPDTIIDKWNWNSLHLSIFYGSFDMVYYLLIFHNLNPNCTDIWGWTPLHIAILGNHVDILKLLLECGAKINKKTLFSYPYSHEINGIDKYYGRVYRKTNMCNGIKLAKVLSKWEILNLLQKRERGNFHESIIKRYVSRYPERKKIVPTSKIIRNQYNF